MSLWGGYGTGQGQFNFKILQTRYTPSAFAGDIALSQDQKYVYVVDPGNNRVQKFTNFGRYIDEIKGDSLGIGPFNQPVGIAIGKDEMIYVSDTNNHRIVKISPGTAPSGVGGGSSIPGLPSIPSGLGGSSGGVASSSYQVVTMWGAEGEGPSLFKKPKKLAMEHNTGYIYVMDGGNEEIKEFTADGSYVYAYPEGLPIMDLFVDSGYHYYLDEVSLDRIKLVPDLRTADRGGGAKYETIINFRNNQDMAFLAAIDPNTKVIYLASPSEDNIRRLIPRSQ